MTLDELTDDKLIVLENIVHDKALTIALIKRSNRVRYGSLFDYLENKLFLGINQYLNNMASTLTIPDCYVKPPTCRHHLPYNDNTDNIDMTFVQNGDGGDTSGTDGITHGGAMLWLSSNWTLP